MSSPRELMGAYDAGRPLEHFTATERAELRRLIVQAPGYMDPSHEHHAMLVADARRLYALDTQEVSE